MVTPESNTEVSMVNFSSTTKHDFASDSSVDATQPLLGSGTSSSFGAAPIPADLVRTVVEASSTAGSLATSPEAHTDDTRLWNRLPAGVRDSLSISASLLSLGLRMAGSYTFSFMLVLLATFLRLLAEKENDPNYAAAYSGLSNWLYVVCMTLFCTSYAVGMLASALQSVITDIASEIDPDLDNPLIAGIIDPSSTNEAKVLQAKDYTARLLWNGSLISVGFVTPLAALCLVPSAQIFEYILRQEPAIAAIQATFAQLFLIAIPFLSLRANFEGMMSAFKHLWAICLLALMNFLIFSFGAAYLLGFGVPPAFNGWGLIGLVSAIIMGEIGTALSFGLHLHLKKEFADYGFFKRFFTRPDWEQISRMLQLSGPMAFTTLIDVIATVIYSSAAGALQKNGVEDALIIWSFVSQLIFWTLLFIFAISYAAVLNMLREPMKAYRIAWVALFTNIGFTTLLCLAPLIYPGVLKLFTQDVVSDETMETVNDVVRIAVIGVIGDSVRWSLIQQSRIRDLLWSTIIAVVCTMIGIGLAYGLAFSLEMGVKGLLWGWIASILLTVAVLFPRWLTKLNATFESTPSTDPERGARVTEITTDIEEIESSPIRRRAPEPCCGLRLPSMPKLLSRVSGDGGSEASVPFEALEPVSSSRWKGWCPPHPSTWFGGSTPAPHPA